MNGDVSGDVSADAELPYAHGGPPLTGTLRAQPEDFRVDELAGFEPSGSGEHALLWVEKRGANTEFVARALARFAGVPDVAIGYAGMKDRHAVTTQRYTVHLPGKVDPDWSALADPEFRVLSATRHARKLPRGALEGNRFRIAVRDVAGAGTDAEALLARIAARGVPNYFGEQRFGRDGANLERALAMFRGARVKRHERGLLLSAARSALFNGVLAARVQQGIWDAPLEGDVYQLDGRGSIFGPEALTGELARRIAHGEIHPTGPLWGRGTLRTEGPTRALELDALESRAEVRAGLESAGLSQERRALRLPARGLAWSWPSDNCLQLDFSLATGAYATAVLRELVQSR